MEGSAAGTRDASRVQDKISSTVAASRTDQSCRQENRRDSLEFRAVRPSAPAGGRPGRGAQRHRPRRRQHVHVEPDLSGARRRLPCHCRCAPRHTVELPPMRRLEAGQINSRGRSGSARCGPARRPMSFGPRSLACRKQILKTAAGLIHPHR
jgi:hypothetical protein